MEITRLREFLGKQMNTKWKHLHFYAYIHQIVWKKLWKALRVYRDNKNWRQTEAKLSTWGRRQDNMIMKQQMDARRKEFMKWKDELMEEKTNERMDEGTDE